MIEIFTRKFVHDFYDRNKKSYGFPQDFFLQYKLEHLLY